MNTLFSPANGDKLAAMTQISRAAGFDPGLMPKLESTYNLYVGAISNPRNAQRLDALTRAVDSLLPPNS
jgi:hypothetical protein